MNLMWNQYVPVLRFKPGEMWALRYLADDARDHVKPLIELLPKNFVDSRTNPGGEPEAGTEQIAEKLWAAWGNRPFFVDTSQIRELDITVRVLERLAEHGLASRLSAIPVADLGTPRKDLDAVRRALPRMRGGACIRLERSALEKSTTAASIDEMLLALEVSAADVDMVVDLGVSDGYPPYEHIRAKIPRLEEWRSFVILGGSFPKDLQGMEARLHRLPRREWRHWFGELPSQGVSRRPCFGDFTVQYAYYVEPPSFPNPSASIRYTSDTEWLIMRGQGIRNEDGPGRKQWAANAQLLCEMPEFCGAHFSRGDQEIAERAGRFSDPGGPTTWIRAAINHHMVFVARQIAGVDRPALVEQAGH
jgi:hypothetical protein